MACLANCPRAHQGAPWGPPQPLQPSSLGAVVTPLSDPIHGAIGKFQSLLPYLLPYNYP